MNFKTLTSRFYIFLIFLFFVGLIILNYLFLCNFLKFSLFWLQVNKLNVFSFTHFIFFRFSIKFLIFWRLWFNKVNCRTFLQSWVTWPDKTWNFTWTLFSIESDSTWLTKAHTKLLSIITTQMIQTADFFQLICVIIDHSLPSSFSCWNRVRKG